MIERAENSDHNEPEDWSETTTVQFKASSQSIGELGAKVSGPSTTVTKIVPLVAGLILLLGSSLVLWLGTGTTYAGWFVALAVLMAVLGTALLVLGTKSLLHRRST